MSVTAVPTHEGTAVHLCCMDERVTCEKHRRAIHDANHGGAFELMSAGGGLRLLDEKSTMWEDLGIALSINPELKIVVCAHTHCADAVKFGLLASGLTDDEQIKQLYAHLDRVAELLKQHFGAQYPQFSFVLSVVDVRTGQVAPRP